MNPGNSNIKSIFILFLMIAVLSLSVKCVFAETMIENNELPLEYRMLFFRNDHRIWMVVPKNTTVMEIFPAIGSQKGKVKAYNRDGEVIAIDRDFYGDTYLTTSVREAEVCKNLFVTTMFNTRAIRIFTAETTAFIEIINARNGFDGVVTLFDCNKRTQAKQSELDIQVTNFKDTY